MKTVSAKISAGGRGKRPLGSQRGMASFAVLLFAMVSVMILVANFKLNYAVSATSDAYDTFSSQVVEKNGIAQTVKESILAIGETAIANSHNSLQQEIQNRLSSMTLSSGVTIAIDPGSPVPGVPANSFFPFGAPPNSSQPGYFSASAFTRPVAGMGGLFTSLCMLGPVADMGRLTVTFDRTSSTSPADNRTYVVNADLFTVPLTNVDVIAYGLPITGTIPSSAPAVPPGFFGPDVSCLVTSSNNPANDPTAYPDLFASSSAEKLPYQYRNAVSFSWNAYEYLWSPAYQDALLSTALTAPNAIYNFSTSFDPSNLQPFPGITVAPSGNSITVDCSAVNASIVAIVDPNGTGSVSITGSPASGLPFILLVRNTSGVRTPVTFTGSNNRPVIYYFENANVQFSGAPQIEGALFLDPTTIASGNVTWFGHFSFYGPASPLGSLGITVADSAAVKSAIAPLAPRVLLVSTNATR
jgi:hypothetical protein